MHHWQPNKETSQFRTNPKTQADEPCRQAPKQPPLVYMPRVTRQSLAGWRLPVSALTDDQKRALSRRHGDAHTRAFEAWWATDCWRQRPVLPAYPDALRGLGCGAKTQAGTPCEQKSIYINGRCKLHGGISTGPTTKKGKARSARHGQKSGRTTFLGGV